MPFVLGLIIGWLFRFAELGLYGVGLLLAWRHGRRCPRAAWLTAGAMVLLGLAWAARVALFPLLRPRAVGLDLATLVWYLELARLFLRGGAIGLLLAAVFAGGGACGAAGAGA